MIVHFPTHFKTVWPKWVGWAGRKLTNSRTGTGEGQGGSVLIMAPVWWACLLVMGVGGVGEVAMTGGLGDDDVTRGAGGSRQRPEALEMTKSLLRNWRKPPTTGGLGYVKVLEELEKPSDAQGAKEVKDS